MQINNLLNELKEKVEELEEEAGGELDQMLLMGDVEAFAEAKIKIKEEAYRTVLKEIERLEQELEEIERLEQELERKSREQKRRRYMEL